MSNYSELKQTIFDKITALGADVIRSCNVERWEELPMQPPKFWPQNIWPWVKNVIVFGIPLYSPMMQTAPSMVYQELYDTTNRILDELAYKAVREINKLGYKAIFFPRDCYFSIDVLVDNPNAAFSHVIAGYYAGLGTIGDSHNLITKEFGPRLRIVSVLTDAPIEPDAMSEKDLCLHCKKCLNLCPAKCFTENKGHVYDYDKVRCTEYHCTLVKEHHWPCGICATVCPVGDDLLLYGKESVITEEGKLHCRKYGS